MSDTALWSTPDLEGFEGESGWKLEKGIFAGVVQVRWSSEDGKSEERFRRIQDIWLQDSSTVDGKLPLRPICKYPFA